MHKNITAFLEMIAISEGTQILGDRGYNTIVGGKLFSSYADHPRVSVFIRRIQDYSTAAGRYQILKRFFDYYKKSLKLKDFSPASQDAIAVQLITECDALLDVINGDLKTAITKCKSRWASFPGAGYKQNEHTYGFLESAFIKAGGTVK